MNPVFVFLVILAAVIIWILCAGLYKYIGSVFGEAIGDVIREMEIDKEKENIIDEE